MYYSVLFMTLDQNLLVRVFANRMSQLYDSAVE
jgi:hypothetical protein